MESEVSAGDAAPAERAPRPRREPPAEEAPRAARPEREPRRDRRRDARDDGPDDGWNGPVPAFLDIKLGA